MLTSMVNAVTTMIMTVLRFWLSLVTFLFVFVFVPMVLFWMVVMVVVAERAGQTPFWR